MVGTCGHYSVRKSESHVEKFALSAGSKIEIDDRGNIPAQEKTNPARYLPVLEGSVPHAVKHAAGIDKGGGAISQVLVPES